MNEIEPRPGRRAAATIAAIALCGVAVAVVLLCMVNGWSPVTRWEQQRQTFAIATGVAFAGLSFGLWATLAGVASLARWRALAVALLLAYPPAYLIGVMIAYG
jgi:multisubunit Na+/H+ antiporter MnhB subunit